MVSFAPSFSKVLSVAGQSQEGKRGGKGRQIDWHVNPMGTSERGKGFRGPYAGSREEEMGKERPQSLKARIVNLRYLKMRLMISPFLFFLFCRAIFAFLDDFKLPI